jgi:hypothetical protein
MRNTAWKVALIIVVILIVIGGILVLLLGGKQAQAPGVVDFNSQVVMSGTIVCLPLKEKNATDTSACTFGLETSNGTYYGFQNLGSTSSTQTSAVIQEGNQIRVSGTLQKPKTNNPYQILGILRVTSVETLGASASTSASHATSTNAHPNWLSVGNKEEKFHLNYPSQNFDVVNKGEKIPHKFQSYMSTCGMNDYALCIYYSGKEYANTNFGSAAVIVTIPSNITTKSQCEKNLGNRIYPAENIRHQTINGQDFFIFESTEAATMHRSVSTIYHTWQNAHCYQIEGKIDTSVYDVYASTVKQFTDAEKQGMRKILNDIAETFMASDSS